MEGRRREKGEEERNGAFSRREMREPCSRSRAIELAIESNYAGMKNRIERRSVRSRIDATATAALASARREHVTSRDSIARAIARDSIISESSRDRKAIKPRRRRSVVVAAVNGRLMPGNASGDVNATSR